MDGDEQREGALELFMSALSHPALLSNKDLTCIACNEAMCRSLGVTRDQLIGHKIQDVMEPSAASARSQHAQEVIQSGEAKSFEDTRGPRTFSIRMSPTRDGQGEVTGLALYAMDITQEKAAGKSAEEVEARYQRIVETCAEGVWQIDTEHKTNFVNDQMAKMLGYTVDEFMGKSMYDFMDDEAIAIAENNVKRRQQGIEERHAFRLLHREGHAVWTAMSTNPVQAEDGSYLGALAMVTDITEQRQLEQRLQQAKKLESLSVLAGGVAHDFNNVLAVILGNLELIKSNAGTGKCSESLIAGMLSATVRATDLTSQMLAFSGRARFAAERLDLNRVAEEVSKVFSGTVASSTSLAFQLAPKAPIIAADPAQIRQMMTCLLTNASDAIGGAEAGKISVSTGVRDVSQETIDKTFVECELVPGEHAFLRISDNGHGMNADTFGRLFEPFFSTRFAGRGLGMAVVLGILRSHRAGMLIDSEEGEGSQFEILFPTSEVERLAPATPPGPKQDRLDLKGHVVVVDDDAMVLEAVSAMLSALGMKVLRFQGGQQALDAIAASTQPIAAALVDITMPGMSGSEVHAQLRALHPNLPIVLSSGYSQEDSGGVGTDGRTAFLKKPYRMAQLVAAIAGVTQK
jgi:PAS domain S-box-containing protein